MKSEQINVLKQDEVLLDKKEDVKKQDNMFDKKAMDYILDLSQTNPGNQTQNDITMNKDVTS